MILVTGAAGFIGSHLCERLVADGRPVVGIDNFDPFYPRELKERNLSGLRHASGFTLVEADVRDAGLAEKIRSIGMDGSCGLEAIVHLAARVGVRTSFADPVGYQEVNTIGTLRMLELARELGCRRVVLASSSSVYGTCPNLPWSEDDPTVQPISPYAVSKLAAELLGRIHAGTHGMRVTALRFFTVYGPRQRPDLAIARFSERMRAGQPVPVFGDGSSRRDYTFVEDIVEGIVRAVGLSGPGFEVINLGNHHAVSLADMTAAVGRATGCDPTIDRKPDQPGDLVATWADTGKAGRLLGWEPKVPLEEGLRRYVDWLNQCSATA